MRFMVFHEMLQRTYLRFTEEEATAKRARAQIRPGDWSVVKRVGGLPEDESSFLEVRYMQFALALA